MDSTPQRQMAPLHNNYSYRQDPRPYRQNNNRYAMQEGNHQQNYGGPQHASFFGLGHQIVQLSETVANGKDSQKKLLSFITLWEKVESIVTHLEKGMTFHCEYDTLIQRGRDIIQGYFKNKNYMRKKEFLYSYRSFDPASEMDFLKLNIECLQTFNAELSDRVSSYWPADQRLYSFQTGQALDKLKQWMVSSSESSVRFEELLQQLDLWFSNFGTHFHQQIEGNVKSPFVTQFPYFKELDHVCCCLTTLWNRVPILCSVGISLANELELRVKKVNALLEIGSKLNLDVSAKVYSDANSHKGRKKRHSKDSRIKSRSDLRGEPDEDCISLHEFVSKSRCLSTQFKKDICTDIVRELKDLHESWTSYKYLNPGNIIIQGNASVSLRPSESCMKYEPLPPWVFKSPCVDGGDSSNIQKTRNPWTADVYSFGQIVLWLVSLEGDNFYAGSLASLRQSCPIIDNALNSDPSKRPTMTQLEEALPLIFDTLWKTDATSSSTPVQPANAGSAPRRDTSTKTPEPKLTPISGKNIESVQILARPKSAEIETKTSRISKVPSQNGSFIEIDRKHCHHEKPIGKDVQQIIAKHKIAESIFQDSDGESVDLDYLQNDIFDDDSVVLELFSEGELSDPNSELAQLVDSKLKIVLAQPEKLVA